MMLVASVFYAFYTLGLRTRPNASPFGFLAAMAIAALITSLPLFVAEVLAGGFVWPTWKGGLLLLYAALGPAFVAQVLFMRGVELIGPSRAGVSSTWCRCSGLCSRSRCSASRSPPIM